MRSEEDESSNLIKILCEEDQQTLRERGWIGVAYMASPLVLSFSLIDYLYVPERWSEFLALRLLVIPASLIYVFFHKRTKLDIEWPSHFFTLFLGTYNSYLIAYTGYESSAYISGLNLVAIGSMGFLPWSPMHLAFSVVSIYLPTAILLVSKNGEFEAGALATNLAFCISTIFLCTITWFLFRRMRTQELAARLRLSALIQTQESIIMEKTRESVYLHKLSRQFSDKTIELVKAGAINLDARERRDVAAIFLDIEGSTKKANTIEHRHFLSVLDTFFNICTEVFIRHDITVGTFLGDGLLAFANAPIDTPNAKQKALQACLEIIRKRDRLDQLFNKVWLSNFNIRIGLSFGPAYCGFFPAGTKGNYSINGPIVNLSSRLCDLAPANSICVEEGYLRDLELQSFSLNISPLKSRRKVKGFEDKDLNLLAISSASEEHTKRSMDKAQQKSCPLCSSDLIVASENTDFSLIKCSSCHYTDIYEGGAALQKAS